jgi:hypothetical protein
MNRKVIVEWEDAWTHQHWVETMPKAAAEIVSSLGVVVVENEEGILLAQTVGKDGGTGNLWFIPNSMILSVRYLIDGGEA